MFPIADFILSRSRYHDRITCSHTTHPGVDRLTGAHLRLFLIFFSLHFRPSGYLSSLFSIIITSTITSRPTSTGASTCAVAIFATEVAALGTFPDDCMGCAVARRVLTSHLFMQPTRLSHGSEARGLGGGRYSTLQQHV